MEDCLFTDFLLIYLTQIMDLGVLQKRKIPTNTLVALLVFAVVSIKEFINEFESLALEQAHNLLLFRRAWDSKRFIIWIFTLFYLPVLDRNLLEHIFQLHLFSVFSSDYVFLLNLHLRQRHIFRISYFHFLSMFIIREFTLILLFHNFLQICS